ncbi:MAG: formate dehydrogenase subunit gamma [Luteimonas sp.]
MGKRSRQIESVTEVVPALDAAHQQAVLGAIDAHRHRPGALLPILHAVQDAIGFVPDGAVARIASALGLTRADVHGVISFYHDFRDAPAGRHVIKLCQAEACQSMGARALDAHARASLGLTDNAQHTADGRFTVEPIYCLGNCALSPALMLDGELHGRVTPTRFDELVAACAVEKPMPSTP